jgi:HEPN domain-containing protein
MEHGGLLVDDDLRHVLLSFATRGFRDQADRDYIAARLSYRAQLRDQFLWSALQALEKYFKSILLFNFRPTLGFGHDLVKLHDQVQGVHATFVQHPPRLREFAKYLKTYGQNRYLTTLAWTMGDELPQLDEVVWCLRRYCQYFHFEVTETDGQTIDLYERLIAEIDPVSRRSDPRRYLPHRDGILETVVRRPRDDFARTGLIWKNLFCGGGSNRSVTYPGYRSSEIPPHLMDWVRKNPDLQEEIAKYVQLPSSTRKK